MGILKENSVYIKELETGGTLLPLYEIRFEEDDIVFRKGDRACEKSSS